MPDVISGSRAEPPRRGHCPTCGGEVDVIEVAAAAARRRVAHADVYEAVENGQLHVAETGDGTVGICGRSLDGQAR